MIKIKRVYNEPASSDGFRVLVDRLWPRGVSKERAKLDLWLKDIAPSTKLRQWFGHDPAKFKEFSASYQTELKNNPAVSELKKLATEHKVITLLYGTKDPAVNHAIVLQRFIS